MNTTKGKKYNCPPKRLYFPADWSALHGYAGVLKQERSREHHARMSRAGSLGPTP